MNKKAGNTQPQSKKKKITVIYSFLQFNIMGKKGGTERDTPRGW